MAIILPDAHEMERMDWREREKAMQRARRTMAALRDAETRLDERLERLWDTAASDWAEAIRDDARRQLSRLRPDPHASEHRMAILEATR